jgi:hypothetical protein
MTGTYSDFSIKLVGGGKPSISACTRAGKPSVMNFPDSREGQRVAASIPIGHRSLVYLMAPTKRIWAAIEYIRCDTEMTDMVRAGRHAAETQNAVALMQVLAPHYANIWRCIRFLAEIDRPEDGPAIDYDFHQGEVNREISQQEYNDLFNSIPWTWLTAEAR